MEKFDVIFGLGYWINEDGSMNDQSGSRVTRCVDRYWERLSEKIIFSGGKEGTEPFSSAFGMARYAAAGGVPPEDLLLDEKSDDTVGHGIFPALAFFEPNGWNRLLVVTNNYHVARAKHILEFMLGPSYDIVFDDLPDTPSVTTEMAEHGERAIEVFDRLVHGISPGDTDSLIERVRGEHGLYRERDLAHFSRSSEFPCLGISLQECLEM
jgi:vancomycin permeability regulator SanA